MTSCYPLLLSGFSFIFRQFIMMCLCMGISESILLGYCLVPWLHIQVYTCPSHPSNLRAFAHYFFRHPSSFLSPFLPSSLSLSPSFSATSETPILHVLGTLHVLTCITYMHPTPYFYFSLANSLFCLNVLLNPLSEFFTLIVVLFKSKISVLFFKLFLLVFWFC